MIKQITDSSELEFNQSIYLELYELSKNNNIPNMIFYGPKSSGKKTLVNLFLNDVFDKSIFNLKAVDVTHEIEKNKKKSKDNVIIKQDKKKSRYVYFSKYHVYLEVSNNNNDRLLLKDTINLISSSNVSMMVHLGKCKKAFRFIVIKDIEMLPLHSQTALRFVMESKIPNFRFIIITNNLSNIIEPLKSRSRLIRVPYPNSYDFINILQKNELIQHTIYKNIGIQNNKWKIILSKYNYTDELYVTDLILDIINHIREGKSKMIINISKIRYIIYNILYITITSLELLIMIFDELLLMNELTEKQLYKIIKLTAKVNKLLINKRKDINYFEYYILKLMDIYYYTS